MQNHNDFLRLYMDYTKDQESPDTFHLWTAITVLAAALGRKCWLDRGFYRLYPNLFVILVAGAAKCRKSTALSLGVSLLGSEVNVLSGALTPPRFIEELKSKSGSKAMPPTLVHSSELSVLFTKQSFGEPLIYMLTDLFDCPAKWSYKTKNAGEVVLTDVFLCILGATTPDGISHGIPPSALREGFASRVLFIYEEDTTRINALPTLTTTAIDQKTRLIELLKERAALKGEFTIDSPAVDWYKAWYSDFMKAPVPDKLLEGMYGRKHDHLLRIAMILAASTGGTVISVNHLQAALMSLNSIEAKAPGAFSQLGGDNTTPFVMRARVLLARHRKLQHSELLRRMYPCDAMKFSVIMNTLIEAGEVEVLPGASSTTTRVYLWIAPPPVG